MILSRIASAMVGSPIGSASSAQELTCNEGRTDTVTILDDFEKVSAFGVAE